jgi:3',5'-cyclic-AMP phosphodiesterase
VNIIQLSDCHLFSSKSKPGYNKINPYLSLANVLQEVRAMSPDLVIASGDISGDGSGESYRHFKQLWCNSGLSCPLMVLPGNHDDLALLQAELTEYLIWTARPIHIGRWHVHGLNTKHKGTLGKLDRKQSESLQNYLQAFATDFHLLAVHHHPLACGGWMDKHEWLNRVEFVELVAQHCQLKAVIYGHIHHDSVQKVGHCEYMSCPSTCWQWAIQEEFAFTNERPGFRVIHLHEDGKVSTEVRRV